MKRLLIVVGTRPNFIKVTQFKRVAEKYGELDIKIVHTGQHFDEKMADVFFKQFNLVPDFFLEIPSASPNTQMAEIMLRLEKLMKEQYLPDLMLVVGDVNSTFAAALTGNKLGVKIGHIESGLRSEDRTMPEEINRVLTDEITNLFFVTEQSGLDNLKKEGKGPESIHFVGNTMIDTLVAFGTEIEASQVLNKYDLKEDQFVLMTMHRPATVDNLEGLNKLVELLRFLTTKYKVVFPIHPRTLKKAAEFGLDEQLKIKDLILTDPLDYFSFQKLIATCKLIITDSGGIQEESTFVKKPCLTLRPNTERPSTIIIGSNELISFDLEIIKGKVEEIEAGTFKKGNVPPLWDGKATERILEKIANN